MTTHPDRSRRASTRPWTAAVIALCFVASVLAIGAAQTTAGPATIDATFVGIGPIGQDSSIDLKVTGRGGVPANGAAAVALNVTATNPTTNSFLTVWPTGQPRPTASNLNYTTGQTIPNMVIVPIGTDGNISLYNLAGGVDVIVDVLGWYPTGNGYTGLTPARLMDTRPGGPTIDATSSGAGQIGTGITTTLHLTGRGGVPANGAAAVALNVTATNPTTNSFLTVWPTGQPRPTASNLNYTTGQTIPNMVIVPIGTDGNISLYNLAGGVDVIVDVLGWYPTGNGYTGLTPARLMDTRTPDPAPPAAIGDVRNLLLVRPALHQMSGTDRIAVWVCDVPANTTSPAYAPAGLLSSSPVPQTIASWAQRTVGPYYDAASSGRYQPSFTALGHIPLTAIDGPDQCLSKAMAATARPFTNVLATDNSQRGDGFAQPGSIASTDARSFDLFVQSPSETLRGMWVGGGSTVRRPAASVVVHEVGHTVHWPHSFIGPSEYDDPSDVMSGYPDDGWCSMPASGGGTTTWSCVPQNTLAFNRFAAGWIDDSQVVLQRSGTATITLGAPADGGIQMIAAPDPTNAKVLLTLEARPKVGADRFLGAEGVGAIIVDQRPGACSESAYLRACISDARRQQQAIGSAGSYDNLLRVGTTTVISGVTITVTAKTSSTFTVQVSGTFSAP